MWWTFYTTAVRTHVFYTLSTHTFLSSFWCCLCLIHILKAASAVFSKDHHCLSLIMADAPGVSLINRQSLLINNWSALLVLLLPLCHTYRVLQPSLLMFAQRCPVWWAGKIAEKNWECRDRPKAKSEGHVSFRNSTLRCGVRTLSEFSKCRESTS